MKGPAAESEHLKTKLEEEIKSLIKVLDMDRILKLSFDKVFSSTSKLWLLLNAGDYQHLSVKLCELICDFLQETREKRKENLKGIIESINERKKTPIKGHLIKV